MSRLHTPGFSTSSPCEVPATGPVGYQLTGWAGGGLVQPRQGGLLWK